MKDFNLLSDEFISIIQSTKNLSSKTVLAYSSDLRDFCGYVATRDMGEGIVLKYVQHLSQERN